MSGGALADLARALHALGLDAPDADPQARRDVAASLGLRWPTSTPSAPPPRAPRPNPPPPAAGPPTHAAAPAAQILPERPSPTPGTAWSETPWTPPRAAAAPQHTEPLAPPRPSKVPAPAPLLRPSHARACVLALTGCRRQTGAVDTEAAVQALARGERLHRLPRRWCTTHRLGVELWVDTGPDAAWLAHDVHRVLSTLDRSIGADRVAVSTFDGSPDRLRPVDAHPADRGTRATGRPVLALLPPPAPKTAAAWSRKLQQAGRRGSTVRALVAGDPATLPRTQAVAWDRHLTVRDCARANAPRNQMVSEADCDTLRAALSLAVRVSPALLRATRRALGLPIAAEAMVVRDRNTVAEHTSQGLVWAHTARAAGLKRLAGDPALRSTAIRLWRAIHQDLTPALHLEEALAVASVQEDSAEVERLLRTLTAAAHRPGRSQPLSLWAARALPALPTAVQEHPLAWNLAVGTHANGRLRAAPPAGLDQVPDALRLRPRTTARTPVQVEWDGAALVLTHQPSATDEHVVWLPHTAPPVVFDIDHPTAPAVQAYPLQPGVPLRLSPRDGQDTVTFGTLDRRAITVHRPHGPPTVPQRAAPPVPPPADEHRVAWPTVDRLVAWATRATPAPATRAVRLMAPGGTGKSDTLLALYAALERQDLWPLWHRHNVDDRASLHPTAAAASVLAQLRQRLPPDADLPPTTPQALAWVAARHPHRCVVLWDGVDEAAWRHGDVLTPLLGPATSENWPPVRVVLTARSERIKSRRAGKLDGCASLFGLLPDEVIAAAAGVKPRSAKTWRQGAGVPSRTGHPPLKPRRMAHGVSPFGAPKDRAWSDKSLDDALRPWCTDLPMVWPADRAPHIAQPLHGVLNDVLAGRPPRAGLAQAALHAIFSAWRDRDALPPALLTATTTAERATAWIAGLLTEPGAEVEATHRQLAMLCVARDALPLRARHSPLGGASLPGLLQHVVRAVSPQDSRVRIMPGLRRIVLLGLERLYGRDVTAQAHHRLASTWAAWPPPAYATPHQRTYAVRHAAFHRLAAGGALLPHSPWLPALELAQDPAYLGERIAIGERKALSRELAVAVNQRGLERLFGHNAAVRQRAWTSPWSTEASATVQARRVAFEAALSQDPARSEAWAEPLAAGTDLHRLLDPTERQVRTVRELRSAWDAATAGTGALGQDDPLALRKPLSEAFGRVGPFVGGDRTAVHSSLWACLVGELGVSAARADQWFQALGPHTVLAPLSAPTGHAERATHRYQRNPQGQIGWTAPGSDQPAQPDRAVVHLWKPSPDGPVCACFADGTRAAFDTDGQPTDGPSLSVLPDQPTPRRHDLVDGAFAVDPDDAYALRWLDAEGAPQATVRLAVPWRAVWWDGTRRVLWAGDALGRVWRLAPTVRSTGDQRDT